MTRVSWMATCCVPTELPAHPLPLTPEPCHGRRTAAMHHVGNAFGHFCDLPSLLHVHVPSPQLNECLCLASQSKLSQLSLLAQASWRTRGPYAVASPVVMCMRDSRLHVWARETPSYACATVTGPCSSLLCASVTRPMSFTVSCTSWWEPWGTGFPPLTGAQMRATSRGVNIAM